MWFDLAPGDLAFVERSPHFFHNEMVVPAAPEQVFAILAATETWPQWFPDFVGTEYTSAGPVGVGATRRVRMKILSADERFLCWEPGRRFSFEVYRLTLPLVRRLVEDVQLEPAGEGKTRLRWRMAYEPRPLLRLVHPLLRLVFGRMFRNAAQGLLAYVQRTRQA